ncbi:DUF2568 domain-containing protein [Demequina oxidasica]|uniref:DUF2568 domain-containing protein n=1 Tax=Demequina oxidasica TaxID=676199 RepID=UPI000782DF79|nr:DUF2568 domain-containing protein [Demequina oxidasica]
MRWIGALTLFLAELVMYWAFMSLGLYLADGAAGWVLGIALLVAVAGAWRFFLSPKALRKLATAPRIGVNAILLLAGAGIFFEIGQTTLGIIQRIAALIGILLTTILPPEIYGAEPADKATA